MSFSLALILLGTLPFQFALPFPGGYDVPLSRALAFILVLSFCVERLLARRSGVFSIPALSLLGSFLVWVLASALWAPRLDLAVPKIAFLFNLLPLFFIWQYQFREEKKRILVLKALIFGAFAAAFTSILVFFAQFLFGTSETFHFLLRYIHPFFLGDDLAAMVASYPSLLVNISGETWLRATAVFPDPHIASFFFGMTGFLALALARLNPNSQPLLCMAALLFLADILTFSRGGYIGFAFGLFLYLFLIQRISMPNLSRSLPLVAGLFLTLCLLIGEPILTRLFSSFTFADTSSVERLALWSEALKNIEESPILGAGVGNYLSAIHPLASPDTPFYAHNLFLDITVEFGLIGALFFFGWLLFGGFRALVFQNRPESVGAFAALAVYFGHSLFETALFSIHVTVLLVFTLSLVYSLKSDELVQ